jgi:acetoin utilization deacetylase AcuC-like enzyme
MLATVYTDRHTLHATHDVIYDGHPFLTDEVPARADILAQAVQAAGLGPLLPPDDHGLDPILAVHDAAYVDFLRGVYAESAAYYQRPEPVFGSTFSPRGAMRKPAGFLGLTGHYAYGVGSPILAGTWEAAYWAAQCALTAAALVRAETPAAYALCRPPGHHAAQDLYGGYCYLNNAAIAARWLGGSTAILDIDYHHGNGTQMIFYEDPAVLFCSLHAHPDEDYPYYWGDPSERGAGAGLGFNHNWTLPQGCDDRTYLAALESAIATIAAFAPQHLVVSAGWDTALGDPVGGFALSPAGLAAMGQRIRALSLPTVIVQEGGYLLERLGENALAFLRAFA